MDAVNGVFGEVDEQVAGKPCGTFGNDQPVRSAVDVVGVAFGEAGSELREGDDLGAPGTTTDSGVMPISATNAPDGFLTTPT